MSSHISNERPAPDKVLTDIADYALNFKIESDLAYTTARFCLMDTLGCGLEALNIRHAQNCWDRSCQERLCRTGHAFQAPDFSSIPCRLRSTLVR